MKERPDYLELLISKGVAPNGCFRVRDGGEGACCFMLSRGRAVGLDGHPAQLTENDIWEWYDRIEPMSREEFLHVQAQARDRAWRARGQPDAAQLAGLAQVFAAEYGDAYEARRWEAVCRYDEETLRRVIEAVLDALPGEEPRRKKAERVFRDVARAKARHARCQSGPAE